MYKLSHRAHHMGWSWIPDVSQVSRILREIKTHLLIRIGIIASFSSINKKRKHQPTAKLLSGVKRPVVQVEYNSAMRRTEALTQLQHGRTLKARCSVREARHKMIHSVWFHLYEISRIVKSMEIEIRLLFFGGWCQGRIQSNCQWVHRVSSGGDENVLEIEVVVAHHCECTKCLWIVHFKMVNFMCISQFKGKQLWTKVHGNSKANLQTHI